MDIGTKLEEKNVQGVSMTYEPQRHQDTKRAGLNGTLACQPEPSSSCLRVFVVELQQGKRTMSKQKVRK